MAFHDHFSRQASTYTLFRPTYPPGLFAYLASLPANCALAWDCGCGSGQAAVGIAAHFRAVVATDASVSQLVHAHVDPRVSYVAARAESPPLSAGSVDLVTVAQALHWFDLPAFYAQVRRTARQGGVIAAWCYGLATISPAVDRVVHLLYADILGPCWPHERRFIEQRYATIDFPFVEIPAPPFAIEARWRLSDLMGYLGTWSAVQRFIERNAADPLNEILAELADAWGSDDTRRVEWPLHLRLGRVH